MTESQRFAASPRSKTVRALEGALSGLWGVGLAAVFVVLLASWGGATERGVALASGAMAFACVLGAVRLAAGAALGGRRCLPDIPKAALAFAGLFLAWSAFSLLPLPRGVLAWLSPEAFRWHGLVLEPAGLPATLAMDPLAAKRATLDFALFLAGALAFGAWASCPRRRDWLAGGLVLLGGACLAMGAWRLGVGGREAGRHFSGPFVNRNHFAGLMAMLAPLSAGFAAMLAAREQERSERTWRLYTLGDALSSRLFFALAAPATFLGAAVLSLSRAGSLAAGAGLAVWAALTLRGKGARIVSGAGGFILAGGAAAVAALGLDPLAKRFAEAGSSLDASLAGSRMQIWRDAWRIAADFPLSGTGPGGFYGVYFPYATPPTTTVPVHVHNDWLQVWVETGGAGFFLFASACACLFAFGLGRWRRLDEASPERPLFAGALGALAGIAAQSLADFSLRMPLNAFALAAIIGLLMGSGAPPERRRHRERPDDPPRR